MPKPLTTADSLVIADAIQHLRHGGPHARGVTLADTLSALLARHGRAVTRLSDEDYAQMQADIAEAEAADARSVQADLQTARDLGEAGQ